MHTASVNPEPESNSFRKFENVVVNVTTNDYFYEVINNYSYEVVNDYKGYIVVENTKILFCALDVKVHSLKCVALFQER